MKQFLAFVKKEFRHIFRDKRTLLILFGMPVAQIMLFGFALNNEIKDAGIAVLDYSKDYESLQIQQKLEASDYFHLIPQLANEKEITEVFQRNQAKTVIIFPAHFGTKLNKGENPAIKIISDASDPNQAQVLTSYASFIILNHLKGRQSVVITSPSSAFQEALLPPALSRSASFSLQNSSGNSVLPSPAMQVPPVVSAELRMLFNPELKAVYMFVPGVMGMILLLVSAMMTSLTIAKEKELGTMELLIVSPLKPLHIILGKVTPYWVLAFLNAVIVILLGVFVFGMPMNGSVPLLIASCLLFSFTALSLGIFISARANTQMTAMFGSMFALLMPTMLLSGFIFPLENMPWILQGISYIIPARWFIEIIKGIMIKGSEMELLWKPFSILALITLVLMVAGMKSIRTRMR